MSTAEFEARLDAAYLPIMQQALASQKRIKELKAGPQASTTATIIEIEEGKVETIKTAAGELNTLFQDMQQAVERQASATEALKTRLAPVAEDATHFEQLFFRTNEVLGKRLPDPPDEKWPPAAAAAARVMFRMRHMQTSPETYKQTFFPE